MPEVSLMRYSLVNLSTQPLLPLVHREQVL